MESPSAEPNQPPPAQPLLEQAPALDRSRRPASRASVAQRQLLFPGPAELDMAATPMCLRGLLASDKFLQLQGDCPELFFSNYQFHFDWAGTGNETWLITERHTRHTLKLLRRLTPLWVGHHISGIFVSTISSGGRNNSAALVRKYNSL